MSQPSPAITVVVPTRDRRQRLERLLRSLIAQTADPSSYEIVIADDGSADPAKALVDELAAGSAVRLAIAPAGDGRGPAAARNRGWRAGSAALIAFIDDDCEAGAGWIESIAGAAAGHPGAIIQGRTIPNPAEAHLEGPYSRTLRVETESPFFETCNIAYPRELLERLGGFDESFPEPAGEDADLGWRALELGASRRFEPRAVVHHAVEVQTPAELILGALRGGSSAYAYKRHPGLRAEVRWGGLFWRKDHALLLLAALGVLLSRRFGPLALLAGLPYLKGVAGRTRWRGGGFEYPAVLIAHDALHLYRSVRASIRHRVLML